MVKVPGVGGQGAVDGVHDGVLNDVDRARHSAWEEGLGPARQPVGLHEEAARQEEVVRRHLPVYHIFCENVGADRQMKKQNQNETKQKPVRLEKNGTLQEFFLPLVHVVTIVIFGLNKLNSILRPLLTRL